MLRSDFLNEMGAGLSADSLTDAEKQGLEDHKQEMKNADLDTSMSAFANQLTQVKKDL